MAFGGGIRVLWTLFLVYSLIIHLNCYHMKNCKKSAFSMDTLIKLFVSEISVNFINLNKLSVYF